jgi:glycosyltransferase involved in cell wall biosynthesis
MIGLTSPLEGGAERHVYEVSSRLNTCTVLTQKGSICERKIEVPIIQKSVFLRVFSFSILAFFYSLYLSFKFKKEYDLIHTHPNLLYFLAPILKLRYNVVVTVHGIKGFKFYDKKFLWFFFKNALKFADKIITVNKEDEKELKRYFGKKVVYIPNGVDLSIYNKINPKIEKKITFIGRIHEQKGIVYLLEAFSALNKNYPEFKLEIIGELNSYAETLKKSFKNKNIIWRGSIKDRKEIVKSLKSAYCIALPSLWEGLPLTLFESLASERPVIVSDIPAFKSVIKNEALFFRNKNSNDLKSKIIGLIKNKSKAKSLGQKGSKLAEKYDWKVITKRTLEVYNA